MKAVRFLAEARLELLQEVGYYEARGPGLGRRFRESISGALALIVRFPGGGAPGPAGTRRTKVRGFPFALAYREEPEQIVIFAIAHDRQQPGYWLSRIPEP